MRILSTTAILSVLGNSVFADGLTYGNYSLDYSAVDIFDAEISITELEGEIEYEIGQILLSGSANSTSINDDFGDFSAQTYTAGAGYRLAPEILIGAGLQYFDSDFGDETVYDIFGQYQTAEFGVGLKISHSDEFDETLTQFFGEANVASGVQIGAILVQNSEFDGTSYFFSGEYDAGPINARAFYEGFTESDISTLGLNGTYDITSQFRLSAAYAMPTGDGAPNEYAYSIGGGYQVTDGVWFDVSYGAIDGDDVPFDINRIRAVLSFETGNQDRIDNRMTREAQDDFDALFFGGII